MKETIKKIIQIVTVVLFFGYMFALAVAFRADVWCGVIVLGTALIYFGIFCAGTGMINIRNVPLLGVPIYGIIVTILASMLYRAKSNPEYTMPVPADKYLIIAALSVFVYGGFFIVYYHAMENVYLSKICTLEITAVCNKVNERIHREILHTTHPYHKAMVYAPEWEFTYCGEAYTVAENNYSTLMEPFVEGEQYKIMINPDNPQEIYRPGSAAVKNYIIFGVLFTLIGVLGLVLYLFQYTRW